MNDAAPAVAEATPIAAPPAPVANATDDVTQETTNPIKTTPEPAKVEVVEPKKKTTRDALEAASEKINKTETAKAAEIKKAEAGPEKVAKPVDKTVVAEKTAETVKAEPWREAPKRFNDAEKAEWDKAPDFTKQGIHRAIKELEEGHGKYKEQAAKYEDLKEFDELATKYKTTIKDALKNYTSIDQALQSNDPRTKLEAIEEVLRVAKVDPRQYAAYISGQPPEHVEAQTTQTIRNLEQRVEQLTQRLEGVAETAETQQTEQAKSQLNEWAKDKPHALRLADQIAQHYQQGLSLDESYAKAVSDAQELAQSMGFIPSSQTPPADNVTELAAHTLKAQKSIAGAPSPGSFPVTQKPSNSIKEAIARAMAQA